MPPGPGGWAPPGPGGWAPPGPGGVEPPGPVEVLVVAGWTLAGTGAEITTPHFGQGPVTPAMAAGTVRDAVHWGQEN